MNHIILGHNIESSIRARFARPSWNRGYGGCIPHPLINITLISPYLILQSGDTSPLKPLPKRPYPRFSQSIQNILFYCRHINEARGEITYMIGRFIDLSASEASLRSNPIPKSPYYFNLFPSWNRGAGGCIPLLL